MRINQFIARATGIGRRSADSIVKGGRVKINNSIAEVGQEVGEKDLVTLDEIAIGRKGNDVTILLNKPVGYVCSRDGQGSRTIYSLLPPEYQQLKYVGRLDKESSGIILLSSDGDLINQLTHPKYNKDKVYTVKLHKTLLDEDITKIENGEVELDGKPSIMKIFKSPDDETYRVLLKEGRNRQIRRTFYKLGYSVSELTRTNFDKYSLADLGSNRYVRI